MNTWIFKETLFGKIENGLFAFYNLNLKELKSLNVSTILFS
jgi:hypothetical protein